MGKNGFIVVVFVFILVSDTCSCSGSGSVSIGVGVVNPRKLITSEPSNNSSASSPSGSPDQHFNKNPTDSEKPKDIPKADQNDNSTMPAAQNSTHTNPSTGNTTTSTTGVDEVDGGNAKGTNQSQAKPASDDDNCFKEYLTFCRANEMVACVKPSKDGSTLFLVVQNRGESDIEVHVNSPNPAENPLQTFDVAKQKAQRKDLPSIVNKNTKLVVNSGKDECMLWLAHHPISVDKFIQQLSFYSKQVTPIYVAYGSFLLVLLFGGTWACCKLRKRNRENGIPYQELEMGLPESRSAANVDAAEGWDHDWDDDDWDEEDIAVKSPAGLQVRNVSADGLTSRVPPKKDGWEIDWED